LDRMIAKIRVSSQVGRKENFGKIDHDGLRTHIYINEVYYLTGRTERYPPNPALASIALSDARMVLCPAVAVRRVGVAIC